ncbi:hypothetical protein TURU_132941 [Turdus rufiventris]|nr:hypothetical protein TURU_132941 [Turdus rufiventris]
MNLNALFQQIQFTEKQAREKRNFIQQAKCDINRGYEKINQMKEELSAAKINLETKVQHLSVKQFNVEILKKREDCLEKQKVELINQRTNLLNIMADAKRKIIEEEDNFTREVTEFNNEYGLTSNRDLLIKKKVKTEINDLENEAALLKSDLEKVIRQAETTTKNLEAEKIQVTEKPQTDPECLRLKKELEKCKDDNWESLSETLQTEIEILQMFMFHSEDVNCILTDWRGGSSGLYTDAVNNVRIVGAELEYLVNFLEKDYGYSPANIHFIGHSLGAHVAGEAGRRKPGIGRITGLDPAGPLFQYTPTMVRLDPSDAKFVDVIHTHAGHLFFDFAPGILQPCGHLDFYPNGGKKMPGCNQLRVPPATQDINDLMRAYRSFGCGHKRSLRYYAESIITPNGFVGYQCDTYREFVLGDCFPCPEEGCPLMGHYADKFLHKTEKEQQKVYLNTGPSPPYARWRKEIHVKVCATETMKGNIDVALTGTNGFRKKYTVDKGTFKSGNTYLNYIDTEISGNISKVEFLWKNHVPGMWIVAFYLLGRVAGKEVCYPRLGCFTDDPPWSGVPGRLLTGLPDPPEEMNISFSLYTRETGNNSQLLLEVENINCIAVDWKEGAKGTYVSAVNNIRVLGAEVAYFITALQKMFGYSPYEIHLIGHSLGAHTAGEAGRRIRGIRRITGLDPAGPYFEGTPPEVRLDPTDANFVDVIHSNAAHFPAAGFGMYNTTGHLDFYPNGGTVMPGCADLIPEMKQSDFEAIIADATLFGGCHHSRSHEFYFASILYPTGFLAYPCDSYEAFKKGACFPCPREGCPMMGHHADRFPEKLKRVDQKFFLNTAADEPFATWRQKVFIKLSGVKKTRGDINLVYYDTQGNSKEYEVASGDLSQDDIYTEYLDVEINPKNTTKIEFLWNKAIFSLLWARLGAETVNIIHGADGHRSTFCGRGTVAYGDPQLLRPC